MFWNIFIKYPRGYKLLFVVVMLLFLVVFSTCVNAVDRPVQGPRLENGRFYSKLQGPLMEDGRFFSKVGVGSYGLWSTNL